MQFFRRIGSYFSRPPFPEFDEFHKNLVSLRQNGSVISTNLGQTFGTPLENFIQQQTGEVKTNLEAIFSAGKSGSEAVTRLYLATENLPTNLSTFSALGKDLPQKKKDLQKAQEDVKYSEEILTAYQENHTKAVTKGSQVEIENAQKIVDEATQALGRARQHEESAQREIDESEQNDSGRFFETVTTELTAAVNEKLQELRALASTAETIIETASMIHDYEDKTIPLLRKKLEDLEAPLHE
jgi:molybdopterin converting factor small subunit